MISLTITLSNAQNRCGTFGYNNPDVFDLNQGDVLYPESRTNFEINVVFHVFDISGKEYVSDIDIYNQLEILNKDYNQNNIPISVLPESFRSNIGNPNISFCIASVDPSGNLSKGIVRYDTDDLDLGRKLNQDGRRSIKYTELGGADAWDTESFLNIWVIPREDILGDSTFPESTGFPEDGIVMDADVIGAYRFINPTFDLGKTLTHEIGHYLGLIHIWGESNGCETDDFIEDTPIQQGPYFGCPQYPQNSCGTEDYIFNFMDFSDDPCLKFFTKGQVNVLRNTLMTSRASLINQLCSADQPNDDLEGVFTSFGPILNVIHPDYQKLNMDLTVFDLSGRAILRKTLRDAYSFQYDLTFLPFGMYIVLLESGNKRSVRKIIIKGY